MRTLKEIETVWSVLGDVEKLAKDTMREQLSPWEQIVKVCVEAGMLAPILNAKNHGQLPFIAAAPFLKRSINDLRCIWLLVEMGYSSQAASVGASVFENALTAAVLASSEKLAREAMKVKYAEIPWGAKKLAQLMPVNGSSYRTSWARGFPLASMKIRGLFLIIITSGYARSNIQLGSQ